MQAIPIALLPCSLCLLLAGRLVRTSDREEWRREWLGELWYRWQAFSSQGEWHPRTAVHLYLLTLGCFPDAWAQFTAEGDRWTGLRAQMRTPAFCAATLTTGLVCLAIVSGYLPATRTILSALPYTNAPRLALVSRTGRLQAIRIGIPTTLAANWLHDSKLLEAMAVCSFSRPGPALIGGRSLTASSLHATPNLLEVMGEPVPSAVHDFIEAGLPVALVSYSFWQNELHADPKIVGASLTLNHRQSFIAGILPLRFWFVSSSIQIYELSTHNLPEQAMLLVRSKPGVSANQLEEELSQTADRNEIPFTQTAPHILFLIDALRTPVRLFGGSLSIALILVGIGHRSRLRRGDRVDTRLPLGNWRWWLFLLLKTAMALLLVFTMGVEAVARLSHQLSVEPVGGPALLWFYIAGCSAVLFAVISDQQARCRVCLQCLAFPIRIGCPGCLFLDWSGTELLCPDGHGVLYIPHHLSCWDEAERWIALEI